MRTTSLRNHSLIGLAWVPAMLRQNSRRAESSSHTELFVSICMLARQRFSAQIDHKSRVNDGSGFACRAEFARWGRPAFAEASFVYAEMYMYTQSPRAVSAVVNRRTASWSESPIQEVSAPGSSVRRNRTSVYMGSSPMSPGSHWLEVDNGSGVAIHTGLPEQRQDTSPNCGPPRTRGCCLELAIVWHDENVLQNPHP
jgi:hypothetical protein